MLFKMIKWCGCIFLFVCSFIYATRLYAQQDRERYLWTDEQAMGLQIVVHIWGEVNKPGQYVVPDGTTVLDLISLAGGPNRFSNLGNVRLTREYSIAESDSMHFINKKDIIGKQRLKKVIYKINLDKYLKSQDYVHIHELKPGDVLQIKRNTWFSFDTLLKVFTQLAIIIQALYFSGVIE